MLRAAPIVAAEARRYDEDLPASASRVCLLPLISAYVRQSDLGKPNGIDEDGEVESSAGLELPEVFEPCPHRACRDPYNLDLSSRCVKREQEPTRFVFSQLVIKAKFLVNLYIVRERPVERSVEKKRPDTVMTPKAMVGGDLMALRRAPTEAWFAITDPEIPAVMTYGPGSSVLIEEGAPHPELMWRVIGTEIQRLPQLLPDLWQ